MRSAMYDPMVLESSLPYPKTLDDSVLRVRGGGIQEESLLENGVDENVTEADSGYMEVTARGGVEVAPFDPGHFSEHDSRSEPGEGAETEPGQEQEPTSLAKVNGKDSLVDEQQYEGCEGSVWKSRAGGSVGRAAKGRVEGEKKRKRCSKKSRAGGTNGRAERGARGEAWGEKLRKNWTDGETLSLLQAVPVKTKFRSRVDKFSGNEASWEGVAGAVSGRTGGECQRRMDTLIKAYKAIKQWCEERQIEVSELTDKGFEDMISTMPKLSTRFKRSWYDYVRDYCPPRAYKKMTNGGGGSPSEDAVNSDSCAPMLGELGSLGLECHNPDTESRKVVTATRDQGERSKAAMEAFVVVQHHELGIQQNDDMDGLMVQGGAKAGKSRSSQIQPIWWKTLLQTVWRYRKLKAIRQLPSCSEMAQLGDGSTQHLQLQFSQDICKRLRLFFSQNFARCLLCPT